jgi:hypothetical protein
VRGEVQGKESWPLHLVATIDWSKCLTLSAPSEACSTWRSSSVTRFHCISSQRDKRIRAATTHIVTCFGKNDIWLGRLSHRCTLSPSRSHQSQFRLVCQCLSVATPPLSRTAINAMWVGYWNVHRHFRLRSITQFVTFPVIIQKKDFLYSLTQLQFLPYCTLYKIWRNLDYMIKKTFAFHFTCGTAISLPLYCHMYTDT